MMLEMIKLFILWRAHMSTPHSSHILAPFNPYIMLF